MFFEEEFEEEKEWLNIDIKKNANKSIRIIPSKDLLI